MKNKEKGGAVLVVLGVVALMIVLAAVGSLLNLITIPWLKFDSQVQMNRDVITQTYDADNALYNYHWFKQKAEEIKATDTKAGIALEALNTYAKEWPDKSKWTYIDKEEYNRLNTNYIGLKNYYNDLVADYNAKAKMVDKAIFKDNLPLFFDIR